MKTKIIVIIEGGAVSEVRTNADLADLEVKILDMDNKREEGLTRQERDNIHGTAVMECPRAVTEEYI